MLITLLANKSNQFGLSRDVEGLERVFEGHNTRVCDPLEPPSYSDVAVHLEVPVYSWMPWSTQNILVVNPEWYRPAWDVYLPRFDMVVVKNKKAAEYFEGKGCKVYVISWAQAASALQPEAEEPKFVWVLGGSMNKRAYVPRVLAVWKESYPPLVITTTAPLDGVVALPENVSVVVNDMEPAAVRDFTRRFAGHVCCSVAEGFGYTAAEAEAQGAFTILNALPCYLDTYGADPAVAFLPSKLVEGGYADEGVDPRALEEALDVAMEAFATHGAAQVAERRAANAGRWGAFVAAWEKIVPNVSRPEGLQNLPPILEVADCPSISVVTLLYNRKVFFDLACHNMMISDYPKDKIEWIIVDDSDDPADSCSDTIVAVSQAANPMKLVYVPLPKKKSVSEKRNIGVQKATADIVLMMDDDDHYPRTSFRRRVAWLTKHPWCPRAVAATTIACYDLVRGISAVNSPPFDIPLAQRVSEATLTFYRAWWEEKGFQPGILVGEGEGFLQGREGDLLEIPPQQVIVAFSHGKNTSSRCIPSDADVKPGCFWGFPKEFLEFVHGLAGIKIVTV
jgi:hypothetical protein